MTPEKRLNQKTIDRYMPDRFATQQIFKRAKVEYEYRIESKWVRGTPEGKPEGKRVVFPVRGGVFSDLFRSADTYQLVRATYQAWELIIGASVFDPVGREEVIKRLLEPQEFRLLGRVAPAFGGRIDLWGMKPQVTLFVPWGVRPEGQFGEPEQTVLNRIMILRNRLTGFKIPTQVLLMPADVYATEVNQQVSQDRANEYFAQVTDYGNQRGFEVEPWSKIRSRYRNFITYERRYQELTPDAIREILPTPVIREAREAAARRSGYASRAEIEEAMFRYLRERIFEAEVINSTYKPIKVSAVAKNKDNFVDRDLPRVYVIPPELQFPWLK